MSPSPSERTPLDRSLPGRLRRWAGSLTRRHLVWFGPHGALTRTAGVAQAELLGGATESGVLSRADVLFEAWCAGHPNSRCDVWLSSHLVHNLLIEPELPSLSLADMRDYVRHQFAHYRGDAALAWPVATSVSAWGRVASVPDGFDLARWRAAAQRHGVRLRTLRPDWARVMGEALRFVASKREGAVGIDMAGPLRVVLTEPGVFTSLRIEGGRCVSLRRQMHDGGELAGVISRVEQDGAGTLPVVVAGHGLLTNAIAGRAGLHCLSSAGSAWPDLAEPARPSPRPAPDFVASDAWPSPLSLALCAVGVATLAASVVDVQDTSRRTRELEALAQRLAGVRPAAAKPAPAMAEAARAVSADAEAAGRARAIVARLQYPWAPVLDAVDSAGAGRVQLLALRHDSSRPSLRIEGQAVDGAALDAFVRALAHAQALEDVVLLHRQATAASPGRTAGLSFEIEARPAAASP